MARRSSAAIRYAEAVFQMARDQGSIDPWLRELGEVEHLMADPQVARALLAPVIPRERKAAILQQALPDLSAPVRRFLDILLHRDRLDLVPRIAKEFRALVNQERDIEQARVVTAVPLDPAERELVAARLSAWTGKRVQLQESVDPSLIGGVIAQVGDQIIDGSVRGRLERLRRALAGV